MNKHHVEPRYSQVLQKLIAKSKR